MAKEEFRMTKTEFERLKKTLSDPSANAKQKLDSRDRILNEMINRQKLNKEQTKIAKGQLDSLIKEGNRKKTGVLNPKGMLPDQASKSGKALKAGKKALSSLPFVSGAVAALSSSDVSAALPVLGAASEIDSGGIIEDPSADPMERKKAALKMLRKQRMLNRAAAAKKIKDN